MILFQIKYLFSNNFILIIISTQEIFRYRKKYNHLKNQHALIDLPTIGAKEPEFSYSTIELIQGFLNSF